jgi:hypothetical protein
LISATLPMPMVSGVEGSTGCAVSNDTTIEPEERTRCCVATMN